MRVIRCGIALAALLVHPWTAACSFADLEREVRFPPRSKSLPASAVLPLTTWFVEKREARNATGGIYRADVIAPAVAGAPASSAQARQRQRSARVREDGLLLQGWPDIGIACRRTMMMMVKATLYQAPAAG